jgi:single-stranded-DNA-specific exonuclease
VQPRLDIPLYDFAAAARLERELGIGHVLAQILVRRGCAAPAAARAFLAADEAHPPSMLVGMQAAVEVVLGHVRAGSPIVVHGDYDVDGVCATAIVVRTLRALGAQPSWFLPSRTEDGYGLSARTVERLAREGARLLVTVDCAITAVDEVAAARAAGIDVVVTDHHAPRADGRLPDAAIVHPRIGRYPCPDLCGTGVAYKLAAALFETAGRDGADADEDLDLVALATVADVVPLRGENRRLVREGLRALAGTAKPGLRALMRVARVDPSGLDATALAFRLAPRINAAGRLQRADAGVELALTTDERRAEQIAAELDALNAERRAVEERTRFEAEALVAEAKREWAERRAAGASGARPEGEAGPAGEGEAVPAGTADAGPCAFVLAGEGWHPGVIGIVASRIAERHHRPAVLVAMDGERGTGSARSIPGFDLLGGLDACAVHLARHGGHRAAAGLEIERGRLEDFRTAFEAHAAAALRPEDLVPVEQVDAVVTGDALGADLAEELEALEPCGMGNPAPTLLVPAAAFADARPMGEGRHVRFTLHAGGIRSRALSFGTPRLPVAEGEPVDATVRLELNEYNGAVEPRLVLRCARACDPPPIDLVGEPEDYLAAALAELDGPLPGEAGIGGEAAVRGVREAEAAAPSSIAAQVAEAAPAPTRLVVDRRSAGVAGVIADLVATGEGVLVACAGVGRRAGPLSERLGGFSLCSYEALDRDPGLAAPFRHVVLLDPPALPRPPALPGAGWTHLAWGEAERRFAVRVLEHEAALRDGVADLYRTLRDLGRAQGDGLPAALRGAGARPRTARHAGRLLRILAELGLVVVDRERRAVTVPPARRTDLARSEAFRSYTRSYGRALRCLGESTARAA